MRPNVLRQTAPINEMNGPKFGIAAAIATVAIWNEKKMILIQLIDQMLKVDIWNCGAWKSMDNKYNYY